MESLSCQLRISRVCLVGWAEDRGVEGAWGVVGADGESKSTGFGCFCQALAFLCLECLCSAFSLMFWVSYVHNKAISSKKPCFDPPWWLWPLPILSSPQLIIWPFPLTFVTAHLPDSYFNLYLFYILHILYTWQAFLSLIELTSPWVFGK